MTIRPATEADELALRSFHEALADELAEPAWARVPVDVAWQRLLSADLVLLAVDAGGRTVGYLAVERAEPRALTVDTLYVEPAARRQGVARALLARAAATARERGAQAVALRVPAGSPAARTAAERLGLDELARIAWATPADLEQRLAARPSAPSFGSIHVQTDDLESVVRAVRQTVPRLPGSSAGSVVVPTEGGWIGVYDELCDRDPPLLRRLARELADRSGAVILQFGVEEEAVVRFVLYDRGRVMDEYCSVPEYHGPLPPGEVVGLAANPTVVARLTGADPARVREVARTAASAGELAPARELGAVIAGILGVPGAAHGYDQARRTPGAVPIER